ncbi:hypothetical protein BEL04_16595 [Mucilaginibacter sp. PPCGB 2223]|uniref:hypothetical protein n=1 Tax=Mucilaginibacter sp. PPCGB 2223 TaxID=1886027 RepID=UPI000824B333|nr:hypothetical protein [Mucilaginibacter sp. PPCGB 2223]OCX51639.1 hypothetical protein BEL04_16595 [Mucilaginibacter sp. PPCGB 2223]
MINPYKSFLTRVIAFCSLAIAFEACMPPAPGFWKNDKISSGKRDDFHDLNKQLFKAILSGHEKEVDLLLSAELLASNYNADKAAYYLKSQEYSLRDEYYIVHKYRGHQHLKADAQYNLDYAVDTEEMYAAFFLPKGGADQQMITVVYGKYKYGWRVSQIEIDPYTINGKTAPQLYLQARADYNKGYFINAVTTMELAVKCLRPAEMWQWVDEDEISKFYTTAMDGANGHCHFPIKVNEVPTTPVIFRVFNQNIAEGTYPAIYYRSKINLKDTAALRKENTALRKTIGHIFPGITQNNKYLLYSAFNELPTAAKYVKSYDVTDRLH